MHTLPVSLSLYFPLTLPTLPPHLLLSYTPRTLPLTIPRALFIAKVEHGLEVNFQCVRATEKSAELRLVLPLSLRSFGSYPRPTTNGRLAAAAAGEHKRR